jgi:hypothetical protein
MNTGLIFAIVIFCLLLTVGTGVAIYFAVTKSKAVDTTVAQANTDKATADANLASAQTQLTQSQTDAQKATAQAAIDKANSDAQIAQLALDKANTITQANIDKTNANNALTSAQSQLAQAQTGAQKASAQSAIDKANSDAQIAQLAIDKANAISQASTDKINANNALAQSQSQLAQAQTDAQKVLAQSAIDKANYNLQISQLALDKANAMVLINQLKATIASTTGGTLTPVSGPITVITPPRTYTGLVNTDFKDQGDLISPTITLEQAKVLCDKTPNCNGFYYDVTRGIAFLKNIDPTKGIPSSVSKGTYYYTGMAPMSLPARNYSVYKNVDYFAQGDLDVGAMSLDDAKKRCDTLETCSGFYFTGTNANFKHIGEGQGTPNFNAGGDYYYTDLPPVALKKTIINAGYRLGLGEIMYSSNGTFILAMQTDGKLVVYNNGSLVWEAGIEGLNQGLLLTTQGNLVVYGTDGVTVQWQSNSSGSGTTLTIDDTTGNLLLKDSTGKLIWSNGCQKISLYRLFNSSNSRHMESTSGNEAGLSGGIVATICSNNVSGSVPLYRAHYKDDSSLHLSSISLTEIQNSGYILDTTLGYVYTTQVTGTVPVYRRYNSTIQDHMLTKDQTEGGSGYVTDNNAPLFYSF